MNKGHLLAAVSASALTAAGVANAADLPIKAAPLVAPASWTGWYVGVHGGAVTEKSTTKDIDNWADEGYVSAWNQKSRGGSIGGHIGINWQEDAFVYGFESRYRLG